MAARSPSISRNHPTKMLVSMHLYICHRWPWHRGSDRSTAQNEQNARHGQFNYPRDRGPGAMTVWFSCADRKLHKAGVRRLDFGGPGWLRSGGSRGDQQRRRQVSVTWSHVGAMSLLIKDGTLKKSADWEPKHCLIDPILLLGF